VRRTKEAKVTEMSTVPQNRMATVASQGRPARSPVAWSATRSELMTMLWDSQTPPVTAARPVVDHAPRRRTAPVQAGLRWSHHWLTANMAAMAAKYQRTAGD
jgi:hypothetical protein